ncbi:PTS system mannose/fructose/sorbose family transporter subunit IID [Niallia sp. FSL W8-0177]|uniref:PTS system mannose/fructose/sorbose family transporter subunit IID n=1 Tax=Niallia sp. FSL W8-0177 TaxID=2954522 RepID=UPI0030F984DF
MQCFSIFTIICVQRYIAMATMLGIVVIGGLIPQLVQLATPYVLKVGGAEIKFQEIFDWILSSLLPLAIRVISFLLIKKGFSAIKILMGMIIFCVLGK